MSTMKDNIKFLLRLLCCSAVVLAAACGGDDDPEVGENEEEFITTVNLTLTGGGDTITGTWSDPEGDGNDMPFDLSMPLSLGTEYALSMEILNEAESPAEDITEEVREEAEEHQVFYVVTGNILTVEINDTETDYAMNNVGDDLPVGLTATVTPTAMGTGTLNIVLKHLPPINGAPQKTGTNTIDVGESDFDIVANVTVQ